MDRNLRYGREQSSRVLYNTMPTVILLYYVLENVKKVNLKLVFKNLNKYFNQ